MTPIAFRHQHSLSTLRSADFAAPRKTRFWLRARLYQTGLVTRRVPTKGFRDVTYIASPFPKLLGANADPLSDPDPYPDHVCDLRKNMCPALFPGPGYFPYGRRGRSFPVPVRPISLNSRSGSACFRSDIPFSVTCVAVRPSARNLLAARRC